MIKNIAVGSKNVAKLAAVSKTCVAYWGEGVSVDGFDVPSGVPAMPLTHQEMIDGAVNRAKAALDESPSAQLGIGLEGGVADFDGVSMMMGYVSVTDGQKTVTVPTVGTPLPAPWAKALAEGAELRPFVIASGLEYDYTLGVVGLLTKGTVQRDEGFGMAVKTALVPWVNAGLYESDAAVTRADSEARENA